MSKLSLRAVLLCSAMLVSGALVTSALSSRAHAGDASTRVTLRKATSISLPEELVARLDPQKVPAAFELVGTSLRPKSGYALYSLGRHHLLVKTPTSQDASDTTHVRLTGDEPDVTFQPFQVWKRTPHDYYTTVTYCSCGSNTCRTGGDTCEVFVGSQSGTPSCQGGCTGGNAGKACSFTTATIVGNGEVIVSEGM